MKELKEIRDSAKAFAREHLAELAREIIEWHDTSLLCDGRLRELSQELKALDDHHSLPMAESFAARAAFEAAAIAPSDAAQAPMNGIPATLMHDEGAIARCSYCGRYSLDQKTLSYRQPKCECGEKHGWSGSFQKPGPDAKWSGAAPVAPQEAGDAAQAAAVLSDNDRSVINMLIAMARAAWWALDNSEEGTGDDGRFHAIGSADFDAMSDALDKLEELPDDKPGCTLGAAGKAEWALRHLLAASVAPAAAAPSMLTDEGMIPRPDLACGPTECAAFRDAVEEMVVLLENGEWAEHVAETIATGDELAERLETAITELHNDIDAARAAQPRPAAQDGEQ